MADGLGAGDNTRAAVITRGLAELTRLGVAMGGQPETFSGLAGMGDLLATCISTQSRNRHVGEELGKGKTIEQIIEEMNQVAEGVKIGQGRAGAGRAVRRRHADHRRGGRGRAPAAHRRRRLPGPAAARGLLRTDLR